MIVVKVSLLGSGSVFKWLPMIATAMIKARAKIVRIVASRPRTLPILRIMLSFGVVFIF